MAQPTTDLYLYVKTCKKTGLKYLGKTSNKNPYTYTGSGKYWRRHLKAHGFDFETQILLKTQNKLELIETGLFFSKLFNVVKSKDWANLKEESGDGGWEYVNEILSFEKRSALVSGKKNGMYGKRGEKSPIHGRSQTKEHKQKRLEKIRGRNQSIESRLLMVQNHSKSALNKKWFHHPSTKEEKQFFPGSEENGFLPGRLKAPSTKGMKKYIHVITHEIKLFLPEKVDLNQYVLFRRK